MAEGVFPKTDGDILFASEANRFSKAGGLIDRPDLSVTVTSGASAQIIGSTVIGTGSLTTPCIINVIANANVAGGGTSAGVISIQLSGTDFGQNYDVGDKTITTNKEKTMLRIHGLLSNSGTTIIAEQFESDSLPVAGTSDFTFSSCFPSSGLVIFYKLKTQKAEANSISEAITTFERGVI